MVWPIESVAHELQQTTARVILRDGQIEIRIVFDATRWQNKLQNPKAWLTHNTEKVMPKGLAADEIVQFLNDLMLQHSKLEVNGKNQPLMLRSATYDRHGSGHHRLSEVILQSDHKQVVKDVTVTLPKSLGSVLFNYVQPRYQNVAEGQTSYMQFP